MNKPTQPAQDYLAALPLTAERSEALNPQTADDAQALEALHRQMGAADANVNSLSADDVALASVKPRIENAGRMRSAMTTSIPTPKGAPF